MFESMRSMISYGYESLQSDAVFMRMHGAIIHNEDASEEFLKLCKEIKGLKEDLRSKLFATSNVVEKMDGAFKEFNFVIEREIKRGKYKNTNFQ